MSSYRSRVAWTIAFSGITSLSVFAGSSYAANRVEATPAPVSVRPESTTTTLLTDSLAGKSGKLWMRLVGRSRNAGLGVLRKLFGDSAANRPGVYTLMDSLTGRPFSFVNLVPFADKERGLIGSYRMGRWPAERKSPRTEAYENPDGFIEVTPDNQEVRVSEHFQLRDFLTHDQGTVWPKYLVLSEALVDKLELTIEALRQKGIRSDRLVVMSGFRTPEYNAKGVRPGGRAKDSRHQFGDAADVFVDNNGDGKMDDLNHDGRVNSRDARFLAQVVDEVERENADLVGGVGVYSANKVHGPFVHVDVRGVRARWGLR
jgi:Peptidase M15